MSLAPRHSVNDMSCMSRSAHDPSPDMFHLRNLPVEERTWKPSQSKGAERLGKRHIIQQRAVRSRKGAQAISNIALPLVLFMLLSLITSAAAVFVDFQNCLSSNITNSAPKQLQWVPLYVSASFDRNNPRHTLSITYFGNVTGQQYSGPIGAWNDAAYWNDPTQDNGKITNVSRLSNKYSTLYQSYTFLTYVSYGAPPTAFCESIEQGTTCPVAPAFNASPSDPSALRAFGVSNSFNSTYAFASIDATIRVNSGDDQNNVANSNGIPLGCISVVLTPDLGPTLSNILTYIPVIVLVAVAAAVVIAAIWSPWGTTDAFRWTSNWGRDQDILRLVTPGFGDCLMYLQFIVLAGSLNLNYPGFFQPVVSNVAWSTLMFNQSLVSNSPGTVNPMDGLYVVNATYGLSRMSQLVGLSEPGDIWAGTVVWTLVLLAIVTVVCQALFFTRWLYHKAVKTPAEDLQSKNWPFTGGNMVRVVCNYFLLPLVSFSMFQLVIAARSPAYVTAFAVVLIVLILAFAGLILWVVLTTKPRASLFDDLRTVLLYGPLYNTYSDNEAPFALVPALLTFVRGIAIGAVQPSGIAQLVLLAICEVVLILTLLAFRPFHRPTSMNAYHIFFASFRLAVILLCVAFAPSLRVTEGTKGWIGYAILVLHGIVLIFGFFLNAIQRLIEVFARMAGAGGDEGTRAATRGGLHKVFGMRQLTRRARRPGFRHSMTSDAAILTDDGDIKSTQYGARSRSVSASSAILLNQRITPTERRSVSTHLDRMDSRDIIDDAAGVYTPGTSTHPIDYLDDAGPAESRIRRSNLNLITTGLADPYYRAPRPRRLTGETNTPGARSRGSWATGEGSWQRPYDSASPESQLNASAGGPNDQRDSYSAQPHSLSPDARALAPSPAFLRDRDGSDVTLSNVDDRRPNVDYAVREVDFYYGVRGPALNAQPTRKLKTGPADPVGPVSSATGWFKNMFNRKSKDVGKGFEVVRSTRAPPNGGYPEHAGLTGGVVPASSPRAGVLGEPYKDNPRSAMPTDPAAIPGAKTRSSHDSYSAGDDTEHPIQVRGEQDMIRDMAPSPINSDDEAFDSRAQGASLDLAQRLSRDVRFSSDNPPILDPGVLDFGSFDVHPSRFNSRASTQLHQPSRQVSIAHRSPRTSPPLVEGGNETISSPSRSSSHASHSAHPSNPFAALTAGTSASAMSQPSASFTQGLTPSVPHRSSRRSGSSTEKAYFQGGAGSHLSTIVDADTPRSSVGPGSLLASQFRPSNSPSATLSSSSSSRQPQSQIQPASSASSNRVPFIDSRRSLGADSVLSLGPDVDDAGYDGLRGVPRIGEGGIARGEVEDGGTRPSSFGSVNTFRTGERVVQGRRRDIEEGAGEVVD